MVIASGAVGALAVSSRAYDLRVAGIISGGAHMECGVSLRHVEARTEGRLALVGKVYCKAEAMSAFICAGYLLTTADIAGYAMQPAMLHDRGEPYWEMRCRS